MTQEIQVRSAAMRNGAALATTVGLLAAGFYVLCAVAVLLWPKGALAFFSIFFHGVNLESIYDPNVGLGRTILGTATTFVLTYAITAIGASLYGRLSGRAQ